MRTPSAIKSEQENVKVVRIWCRHISWLQNRFDAVALQPYLTPFRNISRLDRSWKEEGNTTPFTTAVNHLYIPDKRGKTAAATSPDLNALATVNRFFWVQFPLGLIGQCDYGPDTVNREHLVDHSD